MTAGKLALSFLVGFVGGMAVQIPVCLRRAADAEVRQAEALERLVESQIEIHEAQLRINP